MVCGKLPSNLRGRCCCCFLPASPRPPLPHVHPVPFAPFVPISTYLTSNTTVSDQSDNDSIVFLLFFAARWDRRWCKTLPSERAQGSTALSAGLEAVATRAGARGDLRRQQMTMLLSKASPGTPGNEKQECIVDTDVDADIVLGVDVGQQSVPRRGRKEGNERETRAAQMQAAPRCGWHRREGSVFRNDCISTAGCSFGMDLFSPCLWCLRSLSSWCVLSAELSTHTVTIQVDARGARG